jgi:hypothetical protein
MNQHALPNTIFAPTHKPFVHAIPFAVFTGQQTPLCSTAADPLYGFYKVTASNFILAHVGIRVLQQKSPNFRPLIVG